MSLRDILKMRPEAATGQPFLEEGGGCPEDGRHYVREKQSKAKAATYSFENDFS